MRAIVQRVMKASVSVGDEMISSIGRGICVLIGISRDDTHKDLEYIVRKILNLRIFEDEEGKRWSKSVMDKDYEVLCVSQFTLYSVLKGNKPDFHCSMGGDESKQFYQNFLMEMKKAYKPHLIKDGEFGAYMQPAKPERRGDARSKEKLASTEKTREQGDDISQNPE